MSHCQQEGKDRIIFVTKEDQDEPVQTEIVKELEKNEEEEEEGLLLPNGEINWSCPCLGGMASGPCGVEFRDAFSCFHFSDADPKGSNCIDNFRTMQECMVHYPDLYPVGEDKEKAMMEDAEEGNLEEDEDRIDHLGQSTGAGDASVDSGKGTDDPIPSTTHTPSQNVNKETSSVKTSTESKDIVSSEKETKS